MDVGRVGSTGSIDRGAGEVGTAVSADASEPDSPVRRGTAAARPRISGFAPDDGASHGATATADARQAGQPLRPGSLPAAAREAVLESLRSLHATDGHPLVGADVAISSVRGDPDSGFTVGYRSALGDGSAFALEHEGLWLVAPRPVAREHLDTVTSAWREHFDAEWADDMRDNWGSTDDEIRAARYAILPRRMLWPGESDPYDYAATFPMVFELVNATGSDHGFFAALNPTTGELEVYGFN